MSPTGAVIVLTIATIRGTWRLGVRAIKAITKETS
jgi:hypothetical protein